MGTEYDLGLRVTFDTSLTCRTTGLVLHEDADHLPILPTTSVVMEIKANERIPYWLTEMIAAYNLNMIRISKYCRSIELATGWASMPSQYSLVTH
jgi:hypothetical protein